MELKNPTIWLRRAVPYIPYKGEEHYSTWRWNNKIKPNMTKEGFVAFIKNFPVDQWSGISSGWVFLTKKRSDIFKSMLEKYADEFDGKVATFYDPFIDIYFDSEGFDIDKNSRRKIKD